MIYHFLGSHSQKKLSKAVAIFLVFNHAPFSLISCDILLEDLFLRFTIYLIPDQSFFMLPLFCVKAHENI